MPIRGFMSVPDIPGEATAAEHEGEIDFYAIDWAVRNSGSGATGSRRRRSRADINDFTIEKFYDRSSPLLAKACIEGRGFDKITLKVHRQTEGEHLDYLEIELKNALIVGYEMANDLDDDAEGLISDEVQIDAESFTIKYVVMNDDGSAGDVVEMDYDQDSFLRA